MPQLWINLPEQIDDDKDIQIAPTEKGALEVVAIDYSTNDEGDREEFIIPAADWGWRDEEDHE